MATRHVSVRLAWHDRGWDGTVCADPEANTKYCTASGSLLSGRIARRIDMNLEAEFKGRPVSEAAKKGYVPPCYWSINAHGDTSCTVADQHPFTDVQGNTDMFKDVPLLEYDLDPFSVFAWPFAISYIGVKKGSRYTELGLAQDRIESFVRSLRAGSSIAFIYCTANNPITGDDNRPLLVGAGLVAKTSMPKNYSMSKALLDHMRSQPKMQNFPESAWQFKVNLDPECTVVLPYQEYLKRYEFDRGRDREVDMQKALRSVSVPIVEESLKPHFKYGSMHVPSDKALYLLYSKCSHDLGPR